MKRSLTVLAAGALLASSAAFAVSAARADVMTTVPSSSLTVTDWYKQDVYDPSNNKIGKIDDVLVSDDELRVVAIGQLGVEGVRAGLAVGGVGERALDRDRLRLGEVFGATLRFDVLIDDFFGILGANGHGTCDRQGE